MLNGNDVQLFYRLLDSLSTSLRELAVKYELLVAASARQAVEREKTDASVVNMAKDLSAVLSTITKEFDQLKTAANESKDNDVKMSAAIVTMTKVIDNVDAKVSSAVRAAEAATTVSKEGKDVTLHVDSHMDGISPQLASIHAATMDISKMRLAVDEMKQQFEPLKKLASLLSKPVAIVVGIYVIFVTFVTIFEGVDQYKKLAGKSGSETDKVPTNHIEHAKGAQ